MFKRAVPLSTRDTTLESTSIGVATTKTAAAKTKKTLKNDMREKIMMSGVRVAEVVGSGL